MVRLATLSDLPFFYGLYMHPEVNPFLLYDEMDIDTFRPIFEELQAKDALFVYYEGEERIGMFKVLPLAYRTAHVAYLGGLAIHPEHFGSGHAARMMQEILALARARGVRRLELSTAVHNERAIRLYERAGFVREGVLQRYTYLADKGVYLDEVFMAWLDF